jgi:benzaldehyde dehydrogenase (NAD)
LLKPDVQAPVSGGALIAQLFEEAGLPPGVLHILPGDAETGEALVLDRNVNMISFTGSTAVGRRVGELAGRGLKRVSLELGGNNAYIVLDDADVEKAVAAGAFGSYFFQGQICFTAGRHLVHERVADRYIELLKARTRDLRVGDPFRDQVDLGPMINERQAARVERIVQESVAAGAILAVGGRREGLFFEPTVMTAVTPEMPVFKEEIFGPVAPVTVFHSDDEAVELANMTEYGLVASVQSASPTRALRIANQLHTAMVHINDQTINHEAYSPIGGMGASGNGSRFGALSNGDEFTQWQWVTINEEIPPYAFR